MGAAKRPSPRGKYSAASVVAREMPGWQLVEGEPESDQVPDESAMKIDKGLSIAKLRRKFGVSDSGGTGQDFAPVKKSVKTVRIAPKSGGPAKTADIKNGKIKIVQG